MNSTHPSRRLYFRIWAIQLALLFLTWRVAEFDLGAFNVVVALGIAFLQMIFVILFFMHVRYEKRLTWIFVSAGAIWLLIMIDLTLADYLTRSGPIHQVLGNVVR